MAEEIAKLRAELGSSEGMVEAQAHRAERLADLNTEYLRKLGETSAANARLRAALENILSFQYNSDGTTMTDADANKAQVIIAREALASGDGEREREAMKSVLGHLIEIEGDSCDYDHDSMAGYAKIIIRTVFGLSE